MSRGKKDNIVALTDYGTKEARNHGETVYELQSAKTGRATRARKLPPCERLWRRSLIRREHWQAADRLAGDWWAAGFEPSTTVNLFGIRGGPRDYTPAQLNARDRFNEAMRAVGIGLTGTLYEICCLESTVRDLEESSGWRKGTGLVVLKIALHHLAAHYGYLDLSDKMEPNE